MMDDSIIVFMSFTKGQLNFFHHDASFENRISMYLKTSIGWKIPFHDKSNTFLLDHVHNNPYLIENSELRKKT